MSNYKPFENEMTIEEAIKRVQEIKKEYATMDGLKDYVLAIETLLTAYEKEKEERERIGKLYYEANENCIKYEKMIKKEKEKNKITKQMNENLIEALKESISKDKIKAKIEEIDFMIKEINQGHLQKYTVGELLVAKRLMQSLLEKE